MSDYIVCEADATRYEILVNQVAHKDSDYDTQFVVSLVNFGECFFESDLNFIAEAIMHTRGSKLGAIDAQNIQNAIAEHFDWVSEVKYDSDSHLMYF